MLIPLDDPIWSRLYGPYGADTVAGLVHDLTLGWTKERADFLFWERLHHQDDLYPVTFAALPWIWACTPPVSALEIDRLCFLSHVIFCATAPWGTGCDGAGPRGLYRGLSLNTQDHALDWIPEAQRLTEPDMNTLAELETWFTKTAPAIAKTCVNAVTDTERTEMAMLAAGFCGLHGAHAAATGLNLWADGHPISLIRQEVDLNAPDFDVLRDLAVKLQGKAPPLDAFLREITTQSPARA